MITEREQAILQDLGAASSKLRSVGSALISTADDLSGLAGELSEVLAEQGDPKALVGKLGEIIEQLGGQGSGAYHPEPEATETQVITAADVAVVDLDEAAPADDEPAEPTYNTSFGLEDPNAGSDPLPNDPAEAEALLQEIRGEETASENPNFARINRVERWLTELRAEEGA